MNGCLRLTNVICDVMESSICRNASSWDTLGCLAAEDDDQDFEVRCTPAHFLLGPPGIRTPMRLIVTSLPSGSFYIGGREFIH